MFLFLSLGFRGRWCLFRRALKLPSSKCIFQFTKGLTQCDQITIVAGIQNSLSPSLRQWHLTCSEEEYEESPSGSTMGEDCQKWTFCGDAISRHCASDRRLNAPQCWHPSVEVLRAETFDVKRSGTGVNVNVLLTLCSRYSSIWYGNLVPTRTSRCNRICEEPRMVEDKVPTRKACEWYEFHV